MFLTELKRIKRMICEVVFPTMTKLDPAKIIKFYHKHESPVCTIVYDKDKNEFVISTTELLSHNKIVQFYNAAENDPVYFSLSIWCNRTNNCSESIEVEMVAMYRFNVLKINRSTIEKSKHLSLVPDVDYLEDMEMKDIDQLAMTILKAARSFVQTLRERALS